jgi:hypothetical protein
MRGGFGCADPIPLVDRLEDCVPRFDTSLRSRRAAHFRTQFRISEQARGAIDEFCVVARDETAVTDEA